MLVTFDVNGLFTNIVQKEGLQSMRKQLQERTAPQVPTEYLLSLMDIILNENIFVFYDTLWKQKVGAAMQWAVSQFPIMAMDFWQGQ